jgi:hypothetical protein
LILAKKSKDKLFDFLSQPEKVLPFTDSELLKQYMTNWHAHEWAVNIVTFNYTRSVEKITGITNEKIKIGTHHKSVPIYLSKIEHVHGFYDERMVMGVNDISQIKNESFKIDVDVLDSLVKNECNRANKTGISQRCNDLITKSNLICIFGSSIGDTDKIWWELIGEQLKRDCMIIIFDIGEKISPRELHKNVRTERKIRDYFLSKTAIKETDKDNWGQRIFVGVNTHMFNLKS